MRILGVDPGSRLAGYGCVEIAANTVHAVAYGTLKLAATEGAASTPFEQRLVTLYEGLIAVIDQCRPQVMVVEKAFFAKNAASALKLGQARGVVLLAAGQRGLEIVEYNATEVKASIVGHGRADKEQVSKMLRLVVDFKNHLRGQASAQPTFKTWDASDALALAVCHAHRVMNSFQSQVLMRAKRVLDVGPSG